MALATVAIIATVGSTLLSTYSAIQQGQEQKKEANYQAQMADIAAGQSRVAGQAGAAEERRRSAIVQSNAQAAAAASGGGASDPGAVGIISSIAGEGEYRAMQRAFSGEQEATNYENSAQLSRFEGKQAAQAGLIKGAGTLLGGAGSLYDKYSPASWKMQSASGSGLSPMRPVTGLGDGTTIRWN